MAEYRADLLREWQRQAGDEFRAHFEHAYGYLSRTVDELAAEDATWSITTSEGHARLLLAGHDALAIITFAGGPEAVTINGALHPLRENIIRVSFNDRPADAEVELPLGEPLRPIVREWVFKSHAGLQLPIEYWLVPKVAIPADDPVRLDVKHHERQRLAAHKLASAAGWPIGEAVM